MTFSVHGQAVSNGIAIGRAHLVSHATLEVAHQQLEERDAPGEVARLDAAGHAVAQELDELEALIAARRKTQGTTPTRKAKP